MNLSLGEGSMGGLKDKCFPPGTFQVRARSIRSLVLYNEKESEREKSLIWRIWTKTTSGEALMLWSSESLPGPRSGGAPLCVRIPDNSQGLEISASKSVNITLVYEGSTPFKTWNICDLKSLPSLGCALPKTLPKSSEASLIIGIVGNSYLSPISESPPSKFLHFKAGPQGSSYSLSLLLKFRRHHRALIQREADNRALKNQLSDRGLDPHNDRIVNPDTTSMTLRQRILFSDSKKTPYERKRELEIASKLELLKCGIDMLKAEKERLVRKNSVAQKRISELNSSIKNKKKNVKFFGDETFQLKSSIQTWSESCKENETQLDRIRGLVKRTRLHLVKSIDELFPITIEGDVSAIRWVSFPQSASLSRPSIKQEVMNVFSIVVGWTAHIVLLISRCLNIPLRYPIRVSGPILMIRDNVQCIQEDELHEFPLHARTSDSTRCDYGIYLLNKNLSQLRWSCGLNTDDLRKTLHNLADLYNFCKRYHEKVALPVDCRGLTEFVVSPPPWLVPETCVPLNNNVNNG